MRGGRRARVNDSDGQGLLLIWHTRRQHQLASDQVACEAPPTTTSTNATATSSTNCNRPAWPTPPCNPVHATSRPTRAAGEALGCVAERRVPEHRVRACEGRRLQPRPVTPTRSTSTSTSRATRAAASG